LAQWPAGMIATAGDCPELAIAVGEGNEGMVDFELLEIASFQIFDGPQPLPVLICLMHHLNLLWPAGQEIILPKPGACSNRTASHQGEFPASDSLSVRRRWWLTVIIAAVHAWNNRLQLGFEPIEPLHS
jgi:hypothetical protein